MKLLVVVAHPDDESFGCGSLLAHAAAKGYETAVLDRDVNDTIAPPPPHPGLKYRRIILKLSGEALCGEEGGFGIRPDTLKSVAGELAEVQRMGVQIGIVVVRWPCGHRIALGLTPAADSEADRPASPAGESRSEA